MTYKEKLTKKVLQHYSHPKRAFFPNRKYSSLNTLALDIYYEDDAEMIEGIIETVIELASKLKEKEELNEH